MKLNIYSVYDVQAEAYGRPIFLETDGVAIRAFAEACANGDSQFSKFPEDYILFRIGEYNQDLGMIENYKENKICCKASEFVKKVNNVNVEGE